MANTKEKIIQITSCATGDAEGTGPNVFALTNKGNIYVYAYSYPEGWRWKVVDMEFLDFDNIEVY